AIDELLQRRMLRRARDGYAFATPLMREAAYAGISKADLADRHATLARWAAGTAPELNGRVRLRSLRGGPAVAVAAAVVAEHAERAAVLSDAVGLRSDAPARAVAPLGVAALGKLARLALATGEPAQAAKYAERAATLGGGVLSPADRLVHA